MARISKREVNEMFSFMTWACDHRRNDFLYLLKHKVPTAALEQAGDENNKNNPHPIAPFSLRTSRGQKLAYECALQVIRWKRVIPWMAFTLRDQMREAAQQERNTESKEVAEALAEVILVRVAEERSRRIILSFGSAVVGIKAITGITISKMNIRRLLERLAKRTGLLEITWGEARNLTNATKIKVKLPTKEAGDDKLAVEVMPQVNDWLIERGNVMVDLHRHEAAIKLIPLADRKAAEALDREIYAKVQEWISGSQDQDLFFDSVGSGKATPGETHPGRSMASNTSSEGSTSQNKESLQDQCTAPAPALVKTDEQEQDEMTARFWELTKEFDREMAVREGRKSEHEWSNILEGLEL